jgi:hypothetical protein
MADSCIETGLDITDGEPFQFFTLVHTPVGIYTKDDDYQLMLATTAKTPTIYQLRLRQLAFYFCRQEKLTKHKIHGTNDSNSIGEQMSLGHLIKAAQVGKARCTNLASIRPF